MSPSINSRLQIGSKAPDFTLTDDQGHIQSLKTATGPSGMVLIFYPGDMTPGCTVQLCSIRDDWAKFQQAGITVYGVNQADAASHQRFRTLHGLPFPLLIDTDHEVSRAYGAIRSFFGINLIKRTVVGIDSQGTILFYMHGMPKDSDILKAFSLKP
jgi:peroxiredoxin Q/BCP